MGKEEDPAVGMEIADEAKAAVETPKTLIISISDVSKNILYITRGVEQNQPRLLQRAIRQNATIRKSITVEVLSETVKKYIPVDCPSFAPMNLSIEKVPKVELDGTVEEKYSPEAMEVDGAISAAVPVTSVLPEVEVYVFTLIVTVLLRHNLNSDAAYASTLLAERTKNFNRRSLDLFSSKAYFYLSLSYERIQKLQNIRPMLMTLYRTACVRHDDMGQAVLLNLLLRNYMHFNLIEQAHSLSLKVSFPENASNNQFCRYLYYIGRIQAIQLDYSESYSRLMTAARKAPQGYADGFSIMVHKLIVLVQLLMGDIPERSVFNQKELREALKPYLALTLAVRNGDLVQFNEAVDEFSAHFKADKNFTLVQRLGHNVLKIGLRKISVSYSRISLADIASKLHLPTADAAEYICAKAVRDGVIEAKIDHENGWLTSHDVLDLYSTEEPQKAFHKRIAFCLDVHNDAVKSMRYPPEDQDPNRKKKDKIGDDKDKQDEKTIEELIKEMEDEDMED